MLHLIVICASNYKSPSVMLLSHRVLCTALAGVTVIQIHILHPCSWQDVIIGSENSVKSYHCRDTHTQADAEKLTPCSCRETHTL